MGHFGQGGYHVTARLCLQYRQGAGHSRGKEQKALMGCGFNQTSEVGLEVKAENQQVQEFQELFNSLSEKDKRAFLEYLRERAADETVE